MRRIKSSKRADLVETYEISMKLREISDYILNVINFIQLNRLALKQTLKNIDKEFHAFESKTFKQFFLDYYNQKNSHLKHFLEHPGTLRASFQLKYLIDVIARGLDTSVAQRDYMVPKMKVPKVNKAPSVIKKNPNPNVSANKRMMFSHKNEMDELSGFRSQPITISPMGFETNEIEMQNLNDETMEDVNADELIDKIRFNLRESDDFMTLQSHFFEIHENNMFKQLNIKVQEYYEVNKLNEQAYVNFADNNLTKEDFIYITMNYDMEKEKEGEPVCYSMFDLALVYLHTFLYLLNYYGLAQTSPSYSSALNLQPSLSGVLQAASPAAAIFFGFFINCITKTKYKGPYILCLAMLFVGNFLYFIAKSVGDINQTSGLILLIAGRMIFGSGGSRLMTRKFIAINIPSQYQSKYSTYLVGFSALGITLGPGIASVLEYVPNYSFDIDTFTVQITTYNVFSLAFFGVWLILFFFFLFFFKGYDISVEKNLERMMQSEQMLQSKFLNLNNYYKGLPDQSMYQNLDMVGKNQKNFLASGLLVNPVSNVSKQNNANPQGYQIVVPEQITSGIKTKPSFNVYFPNGMTFFSLWCFLVFKIIQEAYFTEQPQMFDEYYDYTSQIVGWFMLSLTAVGVPTALLTGAATKKFEDRKILLIGFIIYIAASVAKINFEYDAKQEFVQYIIASTVLFIASLVTEAAAISILAKVISPSLKLGFFNAGLLAGTADTVGRALGNASMTLFSAIE